MSSASNNTFQMPITVDRDDFALGLPRDIEGCPVARAIRRRGGFHPCVTRSEMSFVYNGRGYRAATPASINRFITVYDFRWTRWLARFLRPRCTVEFTVDTSMFWPSPEFSPEAA